MLTIILTAFLTLFFTILCLNIMSGEKNIKFKIAHLYKVRSDDFLNTVNSLLGPPLTNGNKIQHLKNGKEIFPSMLEAIETAEKTICFETYIYWSGEIGKKFAKLLRAKAKSGVIVNIILDALGAANLEDEAITSMKNAGINIQFFHPVRWYTITKLNNRTHRKLLIIDGTVGFTGGVGIADAWMGDGDSPDNWRDSHFKVEGPVVAQMQAAFHDNWLKTKASVLHGPAYYPQLHKHGESKAQMFKSSADEGSESARLMYLLSISSAKDYIMIANSYFVPDSLTIESLIDAKKRGVNITIILPGRHIDYKVVRRASQGLYGDLLKAGIEIYEHKVTLYHCKIMVIDDCWVSVGSTNFDNRSFRLNDEANLNVYDANFATEMKKVLQEDLLKCCKISYAQWKKRPLLSKLKERAVLILRPQL